MPHPEQVKKSEITPEFDVTSGVTLSRALVPTLVPNFITRKKLFPLLDNPAPSTTVVIAPAGFGKTSLVAEWAGHKKDKVIWISITNSDSIHEMSALLIQATRNIIPGFADWFERDQPVRPTEVVRRWGNELLTTGKDFILVIDNLRDHVKRDVDIATKLVNQFPANIHLVAIRRDPLDSIYASFSTRGSLHVIGSNELKFSEDEVLALAESYGLDISEPAARESLEAARGWPAAASLLIHQISRSKNPINFEKIASSHSDPIRALAAAVLDSFDPTVLNLVTDLAIIPEFNHEEAQVILEKSYNQDLINKIAQDANFFSHTSDPDLTFSFSQLMREVFLSELRKNPERKREIHERLLAHYSRINRPNLALEHAFLAADYSAVAEIFPSAARVLQATGKGNDLVRWSVFAGDTSPTGLLKRATVELTGRLTSLEFELAQALIEQMQINAQGSELEGFIRQITSGTRAYIEIAYGQFSEFEKSFAEAMTPVKDPLMLGTEEQIAIIYLAAVKSFMLDETERTEELYQQALSITDSSRIGSGHILISHIKAMSLFQIGEYRSAYETASIAVSQSRKNQYVGILGPLSSMFVQARCLLEFSRPQEAFEILSQIRNLAEQWKQWAWYFQADGYFARDLVLKGRVTEALENINVARKKASALPGRDGLMGIIDLSEIFIRYQVKDDERLAILVARAPQQTFVRQIKLSLDERTSKKGISEDVRNLPFRTPREKIWKHLVDVSEVIDQEKLAMKSMRLALEIGSQVGAKETFLRQDEEMGNLIIKLAGENPTLYMEDLASAVAERIKENHNTQNQSQLTLTKRELEVLRHLATERPISAISATLHISQNTMKTHLKNLYRKMEVDGRVHAVAKAKANFIL
jgi:ATP/maltotriose-dependent transcriptional regulator MalT